MPFKALAANIYSEDEDVIFNCTYTNQINGNSTIVNNRRKYVNPYIFNINGIIPKKHNNDAINLIIHKVAGKPNIDGRVYTLNIESPTISEQSFIISLIVESVVASKKGTNILSTWPIIESSVNAKTKPSIVPTNILPINTIFLIKGVYKIKRGKIINIENIPPL